MRVVNVTVDNAETVEKQHVYAIGMFDGVHLGHQKVIQVAQSHARRLGLSSGVVTFDRHPSLVVDPSRRGLSLMSTHQRLEAIAELCVDTVVLLRFDEKLAAMPAYDFVKNMLVDRLRVGMAVVGENHTFGRHAEGSVEDLKRMGAQLGFSVEVVPAVRIDDAVVSSTLIRSLVSSGDVARARRYLGRPFSIRGVVVEGRHLGRQLGFPTMNLYPDPQQVVPARGVYVATVAIEGDPQPRWGICNVGMKPTVPVDRLIVEVHVLDYDQQVYGKWIEIGFLSFLRGEQRFDSLDELKVAISADESAARKWIAGS